MSAADRALLAVLCGLGLVLTASLLPGAGVGTHPAAGGSGPTVSTGTPGTDDGRTAAGTATAAPDEGTATPAPATPTPPGGDTPTPGTTPTPGPTATPTPTETPTDEGGAGGGFPVFPVAVVVGVALVLVAAWRAGEPRAAPARSGGEHAQPTSGSSRVRLGLGRLTRGASRGTMTFVVSLSTSTVRLFDAAGIALREVSTGIALAGRGFPGPGRLLGGFASALSGTTIGVGSALRSLPGTLSLGRGGGRWRSATTTDAREHAPPPDEEESDDGPVTIEDAWTAMATAVPVDDRETHTPSELARVAVAAGLPSGPVRDLTRTFQEVTYGGRPRTRERRRRALEALQRLRRPGEGEE